MPTLKEAQHKFLEAAQLPASLNDLSNPPTQLYVQGPLELSALQTSVAIVGTRKPTEYGLKFAHSCGEFLASKGITVVSGLALGIDAAAHEGALEAKGPTAAVLGTGIDIVYPVENKKLFQKISQHGLLISEFPPGSPPERHTFPRRNRIVAALSRALLVVESDLEGGAMITAEFARKLGRRIFALPGRIDQPASRGPNKLIQDGATLVTSPQELFQFLNNPTQTELPLPVAASPRKKSKAPRTRAFSLPPELAPLAQGEALSLDELATRSKKPVSQMMMLLLSQEMEGSIVKRLDGKYEAV